MVGEPGVGKTALLADALNGSSGNDGSSGAGRLRRLTATGTEAEQDLPFAALHATLLPTLPLLGTIPEPQADALGAALSLRPGKGGDRFAIGAATLSLLSRYAEDAPAVVVLDDVQWMDLPSVEAIAFAARRLADDPVAVMAAARSGGLPVPLQAVPVLELEGLGPEAAALLIADRYPALDGQEVQERLYRVTGGNPLALLELGRDPDAADDAGGQLPSTLPARLQAAFDRRLQPLTEDERAVALVAAVAGDDLRLIRATCDALELDVTALDALVRAGILRPDRERATFPHPLLQSAFCSQPSTGPRRAGSAAGPTSRSRTS